MLPMGGVWEGARETNEFIPTQAMSGEGKQYDGKMSRQITTFFFFLQIVFCFEVHMK